MQIVEARPGRRAVGAIAAATTLAAGARSGRIAGRGHYQGERTRGSTMSICNLPALIAGFAKILLTLVFGPLAARDPTPGQAFTANGLAG